MASRMSSSDSPRKRKYKDIEGYIHTVSEIKIPSSGNRYFDFKIQEKEDISRVVCFSPDKHKKVKDQQNLKTPVRLLTVSPQKSRFQPDVEEYKLYNFSQVQEAKNLSFRWKDVTGQVAKDPSLQQILQHSTVGDTVSVKARVLSKGETTTVTSRSTGKEVKKCELVVSDGTAVIAATIWEDVIETITQGQAYVFGDVRVGYFNKTYLQCAQSSTISPCNEEIKISEAMALEAEKLKPKETESEEIEGRILAADITKLYVCVNCNGRIAADEDNDPEMVKCTSCKQMMLVSLLSATLSANFLLADLQGEKIGRYYSPSAPLKDLFAKLSCTDGYNIKADVTKLSTKIIYATLLPIKKITFCISKSDKIILSMQIVHDND